MLWWVFGLESDVISVNTTRLNITGCASVAVLAGNGDLFQHRAERFGFVFDPVRSATGSSDTFMTAAGGEAENRLEFMRADVIAGRLRHGKISFTNIVILVQNI